jgi:hypothetical protein
MPYICCSNLQPVKEMLQEVNSKDATFSIVSWCSAGGWSVFCTETTQETYSSRTFWQSLGTNLTLMLGSNLISWSNKHMTAKLSLNIPWREVVCFKPQPFYPQGPTSSTRWIGGWVHPTAGTNVWIRYKSLAHAGIWTQDPPAHSPVTIHYAVLAL